MIEGWHNDDHLVLFDEAEVASASNRYAISELLPGYRVIGLRGWDDFILQDSTGTTTYTVATVPAVSKYLSPYALPPTSALEPDARFEGKIKWYTQPIAFGGDPNLGENIVWVSHEEHAQLVTHWNGLYRTVTSQPTTSP